MEWIVVQGLKPLPNFVAPLQGATSGVCEVFGLFYQESAEGQEEFAASGGDGNGFVFEDCDYLPEGYYSGCEADDVDGEEVAAVEDGRAEEGGDDEGYVHAGEGGDSLGEEAREGSGGLVRNSTQLPSGQGRTLIVGTHGSCVLCLGGGNLRVIRTHGPCVPTVRRLIFKGFR